MFPWSRLLLEYRGELIIYKQFLPMSVDNSLARPASDLRLDSAVGFKALATSSFTVR